MNKWVPAMANSSSIKCLPQNQKYGCSWVSLGRIKHVGTTRHKIHAKEKDSEQCLQLSRLNWLQVKQKPCANCLCNTSLLSPVYTTHSHISLRQLILRMLGVCVCVYWESIFDYNLNNHATHVSNVKPKTVRGTMRVRVIITGLGCLITPSTPMRAKQSIGHKTDNLFRR